MKQPRFWYTFFCAPSTETRGRRPEHNAGCGAMLVRSTKREIKGDYKVQSTPCPYCTKRTRLHEGLVSEWFHPEDARHSATEYNDAYFGEGVRFGGEQSGE